MYLSTFDDEELIDTEQMILKSLFVLAFITPREDTNTKIRYHTKRTELENIRYNASLSKYSFLTMINPIGYNLVTKNLSKPSHRLGLNHDFLFVEANILYEYMQVVNVISSTFALN